MKRYKVICAIPTSHPWEAVLEERYCEVENFDMMLMKCVTVEEIKAGVRIVAIYEHSDNGWICQKSERSETVREDVP